MSYTKISKWNIETHISAHLHLQVVLSCTPTTGNSLLFLIVETHYSRRQLQGNRNAAKHTPFYRNDNSKSQDTCHSTQLKHAQVTLHSATKLHKPETSGTGKTAQFLKVSQQICNQRQKTSGLLSFQHCT